MDALLAYPTIQLFPFPAKLTKIKPPFDVEAPGTNQVYVGSLIIFGIIIMGLLDSALGMLGSGPQQTDDPKAKLMQAALALLSDNSETGGLHGLLSRFQQAGLGQVLGSWIGTGQNQPISPGQVEQVLGDEQLQQISQQTGVPPEQAASQLSELLPGLIDKLTPTGEVPQGGLGQAGALLGRLLGKH